MKRLKSRALLLGLLFTAMALLGLFSHTALAADEETYVLMNIPYGDFYAAELGDGAAAVDAVTSATRSKPLAGSLAGGSYHVNADGSDISGVVYPVLVKDTAALKGLTQLDDSSKVEITVTLKGNETTTVYEGAEALFEAPSYSYYVLKEKPAYYKELSLSGGVLSFSAVQGGVSRGEGVTAGLTMGGRHTDIEIVLEGTEGIDASNTVSGVVLTAADGSRYGLRHVYNIWRGTQLGWNLDEALADLGGKTITNIRYITRDSVVDFPVEIAIGNAGYVLMNIPYADFYAAELGETDAPDAVSAATRSKRSNGNLAAGSYHVGAEGEGVDGIVYPVFVPELSLLDSLKQITDDRSVEITTTARGQTSTNTYGGKDSLFEAEDYSWYLLMEKPAKCKVLSLGEDGSFRFSAVGGRASSVEGVTAAVTYNGRHTSIEIVLEGTEGIAQGDAVSAVVLTTDDGAKYGLGHVTNIWRGVQLGWNRDEALSGIEGKTITNIRYYTQSAVIDYPVEIAIGARGESGFTDVSDDAWYADAVAWAVENGVISNRGNGLFGADGEITRSDFVTCLWNAAGKPEAQGTVNPFTDVTETDAFYQAVLWAAENGVTDGTGGGRFSPDAGIDRAQLISFLWKKAGKPAPVSGKIPFSDVSEGSWYYEAVLWAAQNGAADGMGDGIFSPKAMVTRAQIVEFLYKNAAAFTGDFGIFQEIAGENGTTYENLFEVILDGEWRQVWHDRIAAVVGEENADGTVSMLQGAISSELYGDAAIEAFGDGSGGVAFDCWYISGARTFTFKDDTVTTVTEDGSSQTHTYRYLGSYSIGEGESMNYMGQEISMAFPCDVYESTDEAGEFNYFFLRDDTMAETYHIEFRYGRDLKALQGYFVGPYAYWLAAGIDALADEATIENVIELFCLENMDYSAHTDAALSQLADLGFVGTWVADLSAFGEEYAGVELSFTIDAGGHGVTTMNGAQTADFEAYAYDSGVKGDGQGVYVAYSNLEYEANAAAYTLETNAEGKTVLTFYSDEGTISYVKS